MAASFLFWLGYYITMFLLGEYGEEEAKYIASVLKKVGMKVELRTFVASEIELFFFLEGRMSAIKEELTDTEFNRYEKYINALREVVAEGAGTDDFLEKFLLKVDPRVKEKQKQFQEIVQGTMPDEKTAIIKDSSQLLVDIFDISDAESFINLVLERNNIQIGEDVGDRLDDPILRVFDEVEDEVERKSDLARNTTVFTLVPRAQVFVDEFHTVLSEIMDEEFGLEYREEYMKLVFLGKLISDLEEPTSGWMDMDDFRKRCKVEMENEGDLLEIDGRDAVEELAKVLEKNGVIKIKGCRARCKQ